MRLKGLAIGLLITFVLGAGAGVYVGFKLKKISTVVLRPTSSGNQALLDIIARLTTDVQKVTARNRAISAANKVYQDSLKVLKNLEAEASQAFRDTTQADSTRLRQCSVVVANCRLRAAIAEFRVTELQKALDDQLALTPRRCGLQATTGPTFTSAGEFRPLGVTLGLGCRIL